MAERRRRRGGTPGIIVISWRDIPAQVTVESGGQKHTHLLHARFQHAIDRAAMVAGITTSSDYVNEWRQVATPLTGDDLEAAAGSLAAELDAAFPLERINTFVEAGGWDPDRPEEGVPT